MIKQKDAVFHAMTAATEQGLTGDDARSFAVEQVKTGLMAGEIVHSKGKMTDEKEAKSYAGALVSNWLKKDERLNGGGKYAPATKRGPIVKDETLKKLNESLKSLRVNQPTNVDLIGKVEGAIEKRRAEIQATKATKNVQSLDETLAALQDLGIEVA